MSYPHTRASVLESAWVFFHKMTTLPVASFHIAELTASVEQRQARVGIIGLGYVGLPLALLYSARKFKVTGFDIDQRKVETLCGGGSYIFRITPGEIQD